MANTVDSNKPFYADRPGITTRTVPPWASAQLMAFIEEERRTLQDLTNKRDEELSSAHYRNPPFDEGHRLMEFMSTHEHWNDHKFAPLYREMRFLEYYLDKQLRVLPIVSETDGSNLRLDQAMNPPLLHDNVHGWMFITPGPGSVYQGHVLREDGRFSRQEKVTPAVTPEFSTFVDKDYFDMPLRFKFRTSWEGNKKECGLLIPEGLMRDYIFVRERRIEDDGQVLDKVMFRHKTTGKMY